MREHTPTPWAYRPNEHDDWGWIRDADGNLAATARDGRVWSEDFDRYREAKTDPYEPNAAFICKAVNNHDALVQALKDALCELSHCAAQLAARGLPGRGGDSVSRAQQAARDILASVGTERAPAEK